MVAKLAICLAKPSFSSLNLRAKPMPESKNSDESLPAPEKMHSKYSLGRLMEWVGRYETSVIIAILASVAAIWIFIEIADEVREGDTLTFDEWAIRTLRQPEDLSVPIGPKALHVVGRDLTALGGVTFLALLTMSVGGYLWLRKMYAAAILVVAITLGGSLSSIALKGFYDRPRPALVPHLTDVSTSSFPSGHAMLSTVVFLTLGTLLGRFTAERRLRAYFLGIALTLCVLVGLSRVYMGVHYPTDVLAGWVAGLAWGLICWLVTYELQRRGIIEWRQKLENETPVEPLPNPASK
jgi:undecaprenyl-diphosphatase